MNRDVPSTASVLRDWIAGLSARQFFTTSDAPGKTIPVETALSRLASAPDGPIIRVRQGLYWKKPPATRWGHGRPDPVEAVFAVAGRGAGLSGVAAANSLGWTTQVPAVPSVAVVGRVPKGFDHVRIRSRSNTDRVDLNRTEVAVLEALRDFPRHVDLTVDDVRQALTKLADDNSINLGQLVKVAKADRKPEVRAVLAETAA